MRNTWAPHEIRIRSRNPCEYITNMPSLPGKSLRFIFERLFAAYGPQFWWPGDSAAEIVIGAILAQNTAWKNVERAITNLKSANLIDWTRLRDIPEAELAELIRPSGTFRIKAKRLKAFVDHLWQHHGGRLDRWLRTSPRHRSGRQLSVLELEAIRTQLLHIRGIGPETADAILLYAGGHPTFVVDAYTRRVLRRHHLITSSWTYEDVRELFQNGLGREAALFNEFHALFVAVAKRHCRTRARCDGCPLADLPHNEAL